MIHSIESKLWHLVRIAALHKGDRESKYVQRAVESVLTEFATLRARVIREVVEKLANREVPGVSVSVRITNDAGLTGGWDDPESVRVVLLGALVEMIP